MNVVAAGKIVFPLSSGFASFQTCKPAAAKNIAKVVYFIFYYYFKIFLNKN